MIAVDLQHDAHLMQQDLWSIENLSLKKTKIFPACEDSRASERNDLRRAATPTAMEIMSTSIQVLENRLKRNRMAGDPPDILLQPFAHKYPRLIFIVPVRRLLPDIRRLKRRWMSYYPWCALRCDAI